MTFSGVRGRERFFSVIWEARVKSFLVSEEKCPCALCRVKWHRYAQPPRGFQNPLEFGSTPNDDPDARGGSAVLVRRRGKILIWRRNAPPSVCSGTLVGFSGSDDLFIHADGADLVEPCLGKDFHGASAIAPRVLREERDS